MLKKIARKILKLYLNNRFKKLTTNRNKVDYSSTSKIQLMDGSDKNDIVIGDNVRMYGTLITQNHGKINIDDTVKIGFGTMIGAVKSITISRGTAIAHNVNIIDNNNHPIHPEDRKFMYSTPWDSPYRKWKYSDSKAIFIGQNVWIGQSVRINKGVSIGDNSIIAANSVVTKDVPANSIAAGNPAKIVRKDIDKLPRKLC